MPLVDVELLIGGVHLPREVSAFVSDAERRIAAFRRRRHVHGFIRTDFARAHHALRALSAATTLPNRRFLEWGSGMGVVAGLAAMLGFDACGIEIDAELVTEATQLAADHALRVPFACGSYVPEEGDAYARLGLPADAFGVIFAYPWPEEVARMEALFERVAGDQALLLTYHSGAEFRLRRKQELSHMEPGEPGA
jgi:hypothetical protein